MPPLNTAQVCLSPAPIDFATRFVFPVAGIPPVCVAPPIAFEPPVLNGPVPLRPVFELPAMLVLPPGDVLPPQPGRPRKEIREIDAMIEWFMVKAGSRVRKVSSGKVSSDLVVTLPENLPEKYTTWTGGLHKSPVLCGVLREWT